MPCPRQLPQEMWGPRVTDGHYRKNTPRVSWPREHQKPPPSSKWSPKAPITCGLFSSQLWIGCKRRWPTYSVWCLGWLSTDSSKRQGSAEICWQTFSRYLLAIQLASCWRTNFVSHPRLTWRPSRSGPFRRWGKWSLLTTLSLDLLHHLHLRKS